ncbi:hypothetical protein [uncultured Actinomyces sp.]|uniref:hypothetical protein n=1 Tax=uncultured Actinomyces sp. TaxID=249061 RepID=UPI00261EA7E8|nr:hypothetical protein [uncultured Actinomyces sp.]
MSKILRATLPIAFIVVAYTGEPTGTLFGCHAFSALPPLMRLFLLVALGGANAASAFARVRTERTHHLAFWGLTLKVCFLPIFLVNLFVVVMTGRQFSFSPEALVLALALIIPYAVLSCTLMIVSSCYGFAAITRARNKHRISPEKAKKYKRGHAIPIAADLVSSFRLYLLLRRLDGAVATNALNANQPSHTLSATQPVPPMTTPSPRGTAEPHRSPWPTVASLVTSFCFAVTAYAGRPFTMAFPLPFRRSESTSGRS